MAEVHLIKQCKNEALKIVLMVMKRPDKEIPIKIPMKLKNNCAPPRFQNRSLRRWTPGASGSWREAGEGSDKKLG